VSGKITGMLTRAAADFPNSGWMTKHGADNLQNGIFNSTLLNYYFSNLLKKRIVC
jgi:hypothetical protein